MIKYEIRELNKITQFVTLVEAQLFNPNAEVFEVESASLVIQKYEIQDVLDMATNYQSNHVDSNGGIYLSNMFIRLELAGASISENSRNLPYLMIKAIDYWAQKIWARYDDYKLILSNDVYLENIDYSVVGDIPCTLKDVQWIVDENYRKKFPNRQVNIDKTYYQNYINS